MGSVWLIRGGMTIRGKSRDVRQNCRELETTNLHKLNTPCPEWPAQRHCDLSPPPFVCTCIHHLTTVWISVSKISYNRTGRTCVCIARCKRTVNSCSFLPSPPQRIVFPWGHTRFLSISFLSLSLSSPQNSRLNALPSKTFDTCRPEFYLNAPTFRSESFVRDWKIRIFESERPSNPRGNAKIFFFFFRFYLFNLEIVVVCFSLFFFFFLVEGELVSFSKFRGSAASVKKKRRIVSIWFRNFCAMVNNFQIEG